MIALNSGVIRNVQNAR